MNKLMNFCMNHGLIFLNTAPTPQNIKAYFDNVNCVRKVIKQLTFCSSITSANYGGGGCVYIIDAGRSADVILECSLTNFVKN